MHAEDSVVYFTVETNPHKLTNSIDLSSTQPLIKIVVAPAAESEVGKKKHA
jgi:hypothetical protein